MSTRKKRIGSDVDLTGTLNVSNKITGNDGLNIKENGSSIIETVGDVIQIDKNTNIDGDFEVVTGENSLTVTSDDGTAVVGNLTQSGNDAQTSLKATSVDTLTSLGDIDVQGSIKNTSTTGQGVDKPVIVDDALSVTGAFSTPHISDNGQRVILDDTTVDSLTINDANIKSKVLITDASGKIVPDSAVSITELEYLDGVSSSVQGQLDTLTGNLSQEVLDRGNADTGLSNRITAIEDRIVTPWAEGDKLAKTSDVTALETYTNTELAKKRDKITAPHTSNPVVYTQSYDAQNQNYNESLYDLTNNTTGGTIPVRDSNGKLTATTPSSEDSDNIVATKKYVDDAVSDEATTRENADTTLQSNIDTKLTKVTSANAYVRLYGIDALGNQQVYNLDTGKNGGTVAWRDANGRLVAETPELNGQVTTKKYVDDADTVLDGKIDDETTRATNAEGGLLDGISAINAKIPDDASSSNQLADKGYVTSGLALKQDTITGGATTIVSSNLTAEKALVSDSNGKVAVSNVTATELGYVSGVTSAIQTQLNDKVAKNFSTGLFDGASTTNITQSGASIQFTTKNTNTGSAGTSVTLSLPVATNSLAGIATASQIAQIEQNTADISALSGKSTRYAISVDVSGLSGASLQSALTNAWWVASGHTLPVTPGSEPDEYTTLVNLYAPSEPNNHEYTWMEFNSVTEWVDRGASTVAIATNSTLGIVMGTADPGDDSADGNIYIDGNGQMSVIGWDDTVNRISTNESAITGLSNNKVDKLTTSPAGTGFVKVDVNAQGQVTGHSSMIESDIPSLSISKITNLQTSLDAKLDDSQLVSDFSGHITDDTYIPSAKLVNTQLATKQATLIGSGTGQNIKTVGGTSIVGTGDIPFPTVVNSNPTLAWSTKSKVGSVGSTDLEVTMPSNPVTKTNIETALSVSSTYNNQALIVKNGELDFGEAGKVDDVLVNGTSVVNSSKEAIVTVPTKVSDLQNDTGFITGLGFDDLSSHPTTLSGYGITDAQATLVSGTNIKTVNGETLLGSGNVGVGVTSVSAGVGLSGTVTSTGTIKAKLKSETNSTYDSESITNTSGRQYAVVPDKTNGYLSVNVPWTDTQVTQSIITADSNRPLLMAGSDISDNNSLTSIARRNNSIYANPSTGTITATTFNGNLAYTNVTSNPITFSTNITLPDWEE